MCSDFQTRINSIWNNGQLRHNWKEPIILTVYNKSAKKTVIIMERRHILSRFYHTFFS
jgi:hypothetical protein